MPNIAWVSFDLQEHKIHNNIALVMEHSSYPHMMIIISSYDDPCTIIAPETKFIFLNLIPFNLSFAQLYIVWFDAFSDIDNIVNNIKIQIFDIDNLPII